MQKEKFNTGFTLAEVLITLCVIGVVAAMTLPMLANYQKKKVVAQLQRVYSVLSNGVKLSEQENGDCASWDYTIASDTFADKYLVPYLKLSKNDKFTEVHELDGVSIDETASHLNRNKTVDYTLVSGEIVHVSTSGTDNGYSTKLRVDMNGKLKPNTIGKDIFTFSITPDYGLTIGSDRSNENSQWAMNHYSHKDRTYLLGKNMGTCNVNASTQYGYAKGDGCSLLIQIDGWKISKDYPW